MLFRERINIVFENNFIHFFANLSDGDNVELKLNNDKLAEDCAMGSFACTVLTYVVNNA